MVVVGLGKAMLRNLQPSQQLQWEKPVMQLQSRVALRDFSGTSCIYDSVGVRHSPPNLLTSFPGKAETGL